MRAYKGITNQMKSHSGLKDLEARIMIYELRKRLWHKDNQKP